MISFPTAREELIEYVREHFSSEEIYPEALIFEDDYDVREYALINLGLQDPDDWRIPSTEEGRTTLFSDLWDERSEKERYNAFDLSDLAYIMQLGGWAMGTDAVDVYAAHDDEHHESAVAYCNRGLCRLI